MLIQELEVKAPAAQQSHAVIEALPEPHLTSKLVNVQHVADGIAVRYASSLFAHDGHLAQATPQYAIVGAELWVLGDASGDEPLTQGRISTRMITW